MPYSTPPANACASCRSRSIGWRTAPVSLFLDPAASKSALAYVYVERIADVPWTKRSTEMYSKACFAFVLLATVFATMPAAPAFGQSFVGEWTATATTPGGEVSEALSVVKTASGYAVTAKLIGVA